jgi:hypothetical protein
VQGMQHPAAVPDEGRWQMSTSRERLMAALVDGARFDEPCPGCGEMVSDDDDDVRKHAAEVEAYDKGVMAGAADLAEIRSLAAQSTSPGARELMPPRLEELLFPGTERMPHASRRFSVRAHLEAFPDVEIVEPEVRRALEKIAEKENGK